MSPDEYTNLAKVETGHWFYVGKRDIVRHWIQRFHPLAPHHVLADCGAGTGTFAAEMADSCQVIALDDHEESLTLARAQLGSDRVRRGTCTDLPLPDASVDVLTALDVIEHVEEDGKALAEFRRVLRPGGIAVITVPALMMLWSDWDVALHHCRRYTRRSLLNLISPETFEILHCNYVNVAVLPLVLLVRKWRAVKARLGFKIESRSEDTIPPRRINTLLHWSFVRLASQEMISFPAGVGLIVVLRRK